MKRIAVTVNPLEWDHLVTKYPADSKHVTLANFTSGTKNIDTDTKGIITKKLGGTQYSTIPTAAKDQYEVIFADGSRHLLTIDSGNLRYSSGDGAEHLVTAGYSATANFEFVTTQDRAYFDNGVDTPQVYDKTAIYGGVTYTVPKTKAMGAQPPASAPTFAADSAGGAVPAGAHTYKITFLYYGFEESNGGPSSTVHTVTNPNNTVNLTAIPIGGYGVTARKIYRDNNDGNYTLLFTITDNTTTTFADTLLIGATPTPIPTDNGLPPTFGLIAHWLEHIWVAKVPGNPYTLFASAAGEPDIFPGDFNITANEQDPITAIVVFAGRLIVLNRRSMGQILGSTFNDFKYDPIISANSVGCVDNRTVQIRVVDGVPLLIWLSDRGFYSYDGNSINYISDPIEDIVNFNIQQTTAQKGSNNQSTQAAFQAGTPSNGIDLLSFPGEITTKNPIRVWQSESDWEGGSVNTNTVTRDGSNTLKVPTVFSPVLGNGTLSGAIIDSGSLKLPLGTNFTGESCGSGTIDSVTSSTQFGLKFIPTKTGTVTGLSFSAVGTGTVHIFSDSSGLPGSDLGVSPTLTGGITYWLVRSNNSTTTVPGAGASGHGFTSGGQVTAFFSGGMWAISPFLVPAASYTFCSAAVANGGQWVSDIHDTFSSFIGTFLNIAHTGIYPSTNFCSGGSTTGAITTVEGSDDSLFTGGAQVSESVVNLNGNSNVSISGKRYWRVRIALSTSDDRSTSIVGTPTLKFSNVSIWISEAIDATGDVTTFNSLDIVDTIPVGTSVDIKVATSADNLSYPDGFVTFGTQVTRRYIKVRAILTGTSDDVTVPFITSITLKWTIVANLVSSAIDTNVAPPAGWDIFAASFQTNGGTIQFQMRSATTAIALGAATFFTVTNGNFPPSGVSPLRFAQWKVILTSTANTVPEVSGITITWFISIVNSIRPASIFVNGRYYLSVAEFGSTTNNLILVYDLKARWRVYEDVKIATFSFFFNKPYYGAADSGTIIQWLQGFQENGVNTPIDIRFKDLDFNTVGADNTSFRKVLDYVVFNGRGTGATYSFDYSVNGGLTFTPLKYEDGTTSYTSTNDNKPFFVRFKSQKSDTDLITGTSIMIRITTNDAFDIAVQGIKVYAWMWEFEPFLLS